MGALAGTPGFGDRELSCLVQTGSSIAPPRYGVLSRGFSGLFTDRQAPPQSGYFFGCPVLPLRSLAALLHSRWPARQLPRGRPLGDFSVDYGAAVAALRRTQHLLLRAAIR